MAIKRIGQLGKLKKDKIAEYCELHAKPWPDLVVALKAAHIYMDVVTVGATINVMMASVMAEGQTIIENAAKEPHVVDVANYRGSIRLK